MKTRILIIGIILSAACQSNQQVQETEAKRVALETNYWANFTQKFPHIVREDAQLHLGHLNNDDSLDAVIQYPIIEGMKPIGYHFAFAYTKSEKLDFHLYKPNFCGIFDTIEHRKTMVKVLESCIGVPKIIERRSLDLSSFGSKDNTPRIVDAKEWHHTEKMANLLDTLKHNLLTKEETQLIQTHQLQFLEFGELKQHIANMLSILEQHDLSKFKDRQHLRKTVVQKDGTTIDYQVEHNNGKIILTRFSTHRSEVETDREGVLETEIAEVYEFQIVGNQILFQQNYIAG